MGWIKYIIPVGTFAIAIFLACDEDKDNFMKKILQYAVFLLCITTIITVIQIINRQSILMVSLHIGMNMIIILMALCIVKNTAYSKNRA